jgi:hypothetical protein
MPKGLSLCHKPKCAFLERYFICGFDDPEASQLWRDFPTHSYVETYHARTRN